MARTQPQAESERLAAEKLHNMELAHMKAAEELRKATSAEEGETAHTEL